jgi:hypothetical protein
MTKTILSSGCSFTFGHELSDDQNGTSPSGKTWAANLSNIVEGNYFSVAKAGSGNSGIARRAFNYLANNKKDIMLLVMWSFSSRYDWAMPRHRLLESSRWISISPWDTESTQQEVKQKLGNSQVQLELWQKRRENLLETGVKPFAEAVYRYAANNYHETYLSWKSILWLQYFLKANNIPYLFTLADNTLFYDVEKPLQEDDTLLTGLYNEMDWNNWFFFGERKMGFNQWATLEGYAYGTTHPLDDSHKQASAMMKDKFLSIYKGGTND